MSVSDPFATRLNTDLHETSIAALAFHIWESLISLDLEVEHIWNLNKPRTRWIRAVFFFMRYFTLSAQICNRILAERVLQRQYMSYVALRTWYICQVVVAQLSMTAVETVMLARVYALYHNNRWVGIVLLSVLVVECLVVAAGIAITLPHIDFTPESVVTSVPHSFAYLGISAFTTQVIILVLTTVRYFRGHWAGTSLGKLLIRDGSIAFIMFFLLTITLVPYSILQIPIGMTHYAWFLALVSSVGCRLILNMQRLSPSSNSTLYRSSSLELTTLYPDL